MTLPGDVMASPDQILSDKPARVAGLEAALESERLKLRAFEEFAQQLGLPSGFKRAEVRSGPPSRAGATSGGRQPGSISKRQRKVLWANAVGNGVFQVNDLVRSVRHLGSGPVKVVAWVRIG